MSRIITNLRLDGKSLSLEKLARSQPLKTQIQIASEARSHVKKCQQTVHRILQTGEAIYGINTGFGRLKSVVVEETELVSLQENLLRSHAVGVGTPLDPLISWRLVLLRLNSLLAGHSGTSIQLIDFLKNLLNFAIIPVIPSQGSVGASGDLAPLAHMALLCLGEGEVFYRNRNLKTKEALKRVKLKPPGLGPKEGLALINGTQMMTSVVVEALFKLRECVVASDVIGALSLDALLGTDRAFDPRLHRVRRQKGQIVVARELKRLLKGSELRKSHQDCGRVQDPYSLRCMPQVHGAARDLIQYVVGVVERELNAVTDNPLIFGSEVISGGNFHGEPIALAADSLKIAVAELSSISERRIEQLVNPDLSQLPAFLTEKGGVNSGYMMAQVTAAALVSENKVLAHPASVDSIPTSANQEDHVSMGPIAARQALQMVEHLETVLAIELLCACQALDLRKPLKTSPLLEKVRQRFRKTVTTLQKDRQLSRDVEKAKEFVSSGVLRSLTQVPLIF